MSNQETLDDFLNYSSYSKTGYLGWKDDGSVIVWLHKHLAPRRVWRHGLKKTMNIKDKSTGQSKTVIWSDRYVCLESEDVLREQNKLQKLTGLRVRPPKVCPVCLLGEYIRKQINTGKVAWLAPVFKWENDEEEVVIHAQGMLGYPKNLTDLQKRELSEANVLMTESWKEDFRAKMNWVFAVVEHKHPENGVQISVEAGLLGDKVRKVIKQTMEANSMVPGMSSGNPMVDPYPIKFVYNSAKGVPFNDKYDATALPAVTVSDEIDALISAEPPREAVEALMKYPNLAQLRDNLEKHCLIKGVPWDEIFAPAYELYQERGWDVGSLEDLPVEDSPRPTPKAPSAEVVACDHCQGDMLITETVCKTCGHDYDPKPIPAPVPYAVAASRRSRSAAAPASKPVVTVETTPLFPNTGEDEIPF